MTIKKFNDAYLISKIFKDFTKKEIKENINSMLSEIETKEQEIKVLRLSIRNQRLALNRHIKLHTNNSIISKDKIIYINEEARPKFPKSLGVREE